MPVAWSDRHFFWWVLIGISHDLRIFGIPRAFSDGIRPANAGRLQLGVKLTHYSGQQVRGICNEIISAQGDYQHEKHLKMHHIPAPKPYSPGLADSPGSIIFHEAESISDGEKK